MSWLSKIGKSIGKTLNDTTGVSSSAKTQYKNQLKLQQNAQEFSKWQMANAHQIEVEDMKNAGINPVLSAGGSGASAGVSEGSASTGNSMALDTIIAMINTAKDIAKTNAEIKNETKLTNAEVNKLNEEADYTSTLNQNAGTKTTAMKNDENLANTWWGRNISPVLRDIFGSGGAATGAVAGAAVSQAHTSAKKIKPVKRNKIGF